MNRFILFFSLLFLTAISDSCKKETVTEIIPPPGDYFPLSNNSFWSYEFSGLYGEKTGAINIVGKNYSIIEYRGIGRFTNENCGIWDSCFFRKENGKYYQSIPTDLLPIQPDTKGYYEFIFMEDNAPVGTLWNENTATGTNTFSNGKLKIEQSYIGKIEEYIPVLKVKSFTKNTTYEFKDVVRISMKILSVGFDSTTNKEMGRIEEVYDKWYARNIGLIKVTHRTAPFDISIAEFKVF